MSNVSATQERLDYHSATLVFSDQPVTGSLVNHKGFIQASYDAPIYLVIDVLPQRRTLTLHFFDERSYIACTIAGWTNALYLSKSLTFFNKYFVQFFWSKVTSCCHPAIGMARHR